MDRHVYDIRGVVFNADLSFFFFFPKSMEMRLEWRNTTEYVFVCKYAGAVTLYHMKFFRPASHEVGGMSVFVCVQVL